MLEKVTTIPSSGLTKWLETNVSQRSSSYISLHTLLCSSPDGKKSESITKRYRVVMASLCRQFPTKNQSSIGFLFHQNALFCSQFCAGVEIIQREHDWSTFVALNYWYYIMKTSSRLVLCPREPVLNHKMMKFLWEKLWERIDVLIRQN